MSTTKVLLITPPPINVHKAVPYSAEDLSLEGEQLEKWERQFEEECRERMGFRTWLNKLKYAEAVVRLADSFQEAGSAGEGRVAVVDFWRALTNFGLSKERRAELGEGEVNTEVNGKWPGSGLPGAKEFEKGVFTDMLHLGEKVSWLTSFRIWTNNVF
jgi:isoamyl acetate esterase